MTATVTLCGGDRCYTMEKSKKSKSVFVLYSGFQRVLQILPQQCAFSTCPRSDNGKGILLYSTAFQRFPLFRRGICEVCFGPTLKSNSERNERTQIFTPGVSFVFAVVFDRSGQLTRVRRTTGSIHTCDRRTHNYRSTPGPRSRS